MNEVNGAQRNERSEWSAAFYIYVGLRPPLAYGTKGL